MFDNALGARDAMESLISAEIGRLAVEADVAVFAHYADDSLGDEALDFKVQTRQEAPDGRIALDVDFDFVGIGIWFLCRRHDDTFHMRHIVVEIDEEGRFVRGQVGEQEGYWEDFPAYVTDSRLVSTIVHARAA